MRNIFSLPLDKFGSFHVLELGVGLARREKMYEEAFLNFLLIFFWQFIELFE